jgi:hypothetical protein
VLTSCNIVQSQRGLSAFFAGSKKGRAQVGMQQYPTNLEDIPRADMLQNAGIFPTFPTL